MQYLISLLPVFICTEKTVCFFLRNQQITKFFKSLIPQGKLFHNDDTEVCCLDMKSTFNTSVNYSHPYVLSGLTLYSVIHVDSATTQL